MAISTLKNRETYTSTANQTSFDFTVSGVRVPFFANSDIKVFKRASGETADTELTFNASPSDNTQFSITAVNNDTRQGGTIVIGGTGYADGTFITIERVVPFTQEYTLQEGSSIDPTALNTAIDRVVAQTQQLDDDRSVTFPASDASSVTYNITESAASRASKVLGFDSSGNINTQTFSSVAGDAVTGGNGIDITANNISVDVTSDFTFNSGELALATDSVDTAEIKANAVDTAEIADSAVTEAKIGNNAVTASKIAGNAVGSAQISDGAVTSSELAGNAVSLPTMAQIATNHIIGRTSAGTGNPEHIALGNPFYEYYSADCRGGTGNWRWKNWNIITNSPHANFGSFDSNGIWTFTSTGTYLVDLQYEHADKDTTSGDTYTTQFTKGDNTGSDTSTNMAGTVWTGTRIAQGTGTSRDRLSDTFPNTGASTSTNNQNGGADLTPYARIIKHILTISDVSTDKLQVANDDAGTGADHSLWDARATLKITKLT